MFVIEGVEIPYTTVALSSLVIWDLRILSNRGELFIIHW